MKIPILYRILEYDQLKEDNIRLKAELDSHKDIIKQFLKELRTKLSTDMSSLQAQEGKLDDRHRLLLSLLLKGKSGTPKNLALLTNRSSKSISTDLIQLYGLGYLDREKEGRSYKYCITGDLRGKLASIASKEV